MRFAEQGGTQSRQVARGDEPEICYSPVGVAEDSPSSSASADGLLAYREKRNPLATNEPFGVAVDGAVATWSGDFVVHLHAATRKHYDLRLQVGTVLKSFAVPKGPSLDPAQKRLAVQTEDHPLPYLDFEDVIPDGNYGAGPMIVWDIGRVQFLEQPAEEGIERGKLDFLLFGRKLRGRFALVETGGAKRPKPKQRSWLLLKKQDGHCVSEDQEPVLTQPESVLSGLSVEQLSQRDRHQAELLQLARELGAPQSRELDLSSLSPMLLASEGASLNDAQRIYELKLDGVRILAQRRGDEVRLRYRSGRAATISYPEVVRALETVFVSDFVVDGEIVSFDERGKPNFQRLATRFAATRPADVRRARHAVPVVYWVFDLLRLGPFDLTAMPLLARKQLLRRLIPGKGIVRWLDHIDTHGDQLYELCCQQGLEGVVSKLKSAPYQVGQRSPAWVKHRCEREEDFVVVGWVAGKGSRKNLGALTLATYRGEQLVYRGRVGSGFDAATLKRLKQELQARVSEEPTCVGLPEDGPEHHFVRPELVVRVRFLEWTSERRIRMAVFVGLRPQQDPAACRAAPDEELWEPTMAPASEGGVDEALLELASSVASPVQAERGGAAPSLNTVAQALQYQQGQPGLARALGRRVALSNLDKVYWPETGYTKGDLLDYYAAVAPALLPHLANRPVMLVRYPDGVTGKSFYQWNVPRGTPAWLRTLQLRREEEDGKEVTTFLIDDADSLLHIINLGCIPIHVLACRSTSRDSCDFLTIDFDLGEHPFQDAVRLALVLRELLQELGLRGYPKTSGQTGLHVLIPLNPPVPFDAAKVLVELLGRLVQQRHPEMSTMERRVSQRGGRIYIDTGQTGRSRTIVAPYSVRAHAEARVSTPLEWDELHLALRPDRFTIFTVPARVANHGDPMQDFEQYEPNLAQVLERLERWLTR